MLSQTNVNSNLSPSDESVRVPAEVINLNGTCPLLLICEHASNHIPPEFDDLGIDDGTLTSHAAYDIGIREVAIGISEILDAPLVVSNISRLVVDCNRDPYSPDSMPAQSEIYRIPGNENLSDAEKRYRVKNYYYPFHDLVRETLQSNPRCKALVALHSFTPVFMGVDRGMELGILYEQDQPLANIILDNYKAFTQLITVANEPYAPDPRVSHTVRKHTFSRNMPHVMIEVRNTLIRENEKQQEMARMLAELFRYAMEEMQARQDQSP